MSSTQTDLSDLRLTVQARYGEGATRDELRDLARRVRDFRPATSRARP